MINELVEQEARLVNAVPCTHQQVLVNLKSCCDRESAPWYKHQSTAVLRFAKLLEMFWFAPSCLMFARCRPGSVI